MNITVVFSPKLKDSILSTSRRLANFENSMLIQKISLIYPDVEVEDCIIKVHYEEYIEKVKKLPFYSTAIESLKGVVKAADLIRDYDLILVPTSGTGYVAEKDKMRGYSIFNDVAILVERLVENGYKKIVVINTDAHHGNFTLVEEKAICLCVLGEVKCSKIDRFVCKPARNIPKEKYIENLKKNLKIIDENDPDVVVWYLGQDMHFLEYSGMELDKECYKEMFETMLKIANKRKLIVILASGSREDVFDEIIECFRLIIQNLFSN